MKTDLRHNWVGTDLMGIGTDLMGIGTALMGIGTDLMRQTHGDGVGSNTNFFRLSLSDTDTAAALLLRYGRDQFVTSAQLPVKMGRRPKRMRDAFMAWLKGGCFWWRTGMARSFKSNAGISTKTRTMIDSVDLTLNGERQG